MADIKNQNELKRRTELFLDEFSHEEYMINEPFCKETMRMMREFIGRACHLLDCKDAHIKKVRNNAKKERAKAIDEFAKKICEKYTEEERKGNYRQYCASIKQDIADIAERMKGGAKC